LEYSDPMPKIPRKLRKGADYCGRCYKCKITYMSDVLYRFCPVHGTPLTYKRQKVGWILPDVMWKARFRELERENAVN